VLWLLAALAPLAAAGQGTASGVSVTASIEPPAATVGDRMRLTLEVERPPDVQVRFPDVTSLVAPFDVLSTVTLPPEEKSGSIVESRVFVVTAFEPGESRVPALPFRVTGAAGETTTVWSDSVAVSIASVLPDTLDAAKAKPRDIKPPVELPRRVWPYVLAAALAALAALGARFLSRFLRLRRRPAAPVPAVEPEAARRAAHIAALRGLAALEAQDFVGRGEIAVFYVRLTEVVRLYVRDRFAVDAIDMTTEELRPAMADARIEDREIAWTIGLLNRADLAKFARHRPSDEQARADLEETRAFVERTRFRGAEEDDA
jgi:hypothetical protein